MKRVRSMWWRLACSPWMLAVGAAVTLVDGALLERHRSLVREALGPPYSIPNDTPAFGFMVDEDGTVRRMRRPGDRYPPDMSGSVRPWREHEMFVWAPLWDTYTTRMDLKLYSLKSVTTDQRASARGIVADVFDGEVPSEYIDGLRAGKDRVRVYHPLAFVRTGAEAVLWVFLLARWLPWIWEAGLKGIDRARLSPPTTK